MPEPNRNEQSDNLTYTLANPIQDIGEEVKQITLRPPKGKEIRKIGMPFSYSSDGRSSADMEAIARYIEVLGNISKPGVDSLSAEDFQNLTVQVIAFFGSAQETS